VDDEQRCRQHIDDLCTLYLDRVGDAMTPAQWREAADAAHALLMVFIEIDADNDAAGLGTKPTLAERVAWMAKNDK
jgi:hypothetical protein